MREKIEAFKNESPTQSGDSQDRLWPFLLEGEEKQIFLTMIAGYSRSPKAGTWDLSLHKRRGLDYMWFFLCRNSRSL